MASLVTTTLLLGIFVFYHAIWLDGRTYAAMIKKSGRCVDGSVDEDCKIGAQAAAEWAPVIWLHPDEKFFPSDVHSFIRRTTHFNGEEYCHSTSACSGEIKITPLLGERDSWDTYLMAPIDIDCSNCTIPQFIFGTRPSDQESPQVYAVVNSCLPHKRHRKRDTTTRSEVTNEAHTWRITEDDNIHPRWLTHNNISQKYSSYNIPPQQQRFSVTYWMFYPYNHGKKVCSINLHWLGHVFKPRVYGVCYGQEILLGNHVGDWEHVSIDFIDNTPIEMYISSHSFGAFYRYNSEKHLFYYSHQDTRKGMNRHKNFPIVVYMDNNHPVLYSALGSHGLWPEPGVHQYNHLPYLVDETASGDQWRTWENLDIIDLRNEDALSKPHRWWLHYEGRWRNPAKNCHPLLAGFCEQSHGPTGIPRKRTTFLCT